MARVPLRSPLDRAIVAGIAALFLLVLATLYVGWRYIEHRSDRLVEEALDDRIRSAEVRLESWSSGWSEVIEVEAAFLARPHRAEPMDLANRWHAIMEAYWPILAIRLSDANGNEVALIRQDSMIVWQETTKGGKEGPSILKRVDVPPVDTATNTWSEEQVNDAREQVWFGNALQNEQLDAIWSGPEAADDRMHLSQLLRPTVAGAPYRILALTIDPRRSGSKLVGHTADTTSFAFVWLPSGEVIKQLSVQDRHWTDLLDEAVRAFLAHRSDATSHIGNGAYRTRATTHALNGSFLTVGSVVLAEAVSARIALSRWIVIGGLVVTVLLGVLLLVSFDRRRLDLLRLRAEQDNALAQQARLEKALGERDVLDRETHHRVKNNLQVVSSMLNLQALRMPEGPLKEEFLRGRSRIDMMAMVHHRLYAMPDLRDVDLQGFFEGLAHDVAQRHFSHSHGISWEVDAGGVKAVTDPAIDLGIILCELLSNCHQHAFPYSTGGHIDVRVEHTGDSAYRMVVKDNGVGMRKEADRQGGNLGLEIVEALAQELDGTFIIQHTDMGTTCELRFRMRPTAA